MEVVLEEVLRSNDPRLFRCRQAMLSIGLLEAATIVKDAITNGDEHSVVVGRFWRSMPASSEEIGQLDYD